MSLPYFPLYPADYEAKTAHLSLEEDGAYNRLLRLCWVTPGCSVPNDRAWLMRRLRVSEDTYDRVVAVVIEEFFKTRRGRLYQAKLTKIYEETSAAHNRRVQAGAKGGRPRKSLEINETSETNAKAMLKQPEPEPEPYKRKEAKASSQKIRACRLSPEWSLPSDWRQWAEAQGFSALSVTAQAERFRDYWIAQPGQKGVKADWLATWRNWIRNNATAPPLLRAVGDGFAPQEPIRIRPQLPKEFSDDRPN